MLSYLKIRRLTFTITNFSYDCINKVRHVQLVCLVLVLYFFLQIHPSKDHPKWNNIINRVGYPTFSLLAVGDLLLRASSQSFNNWLLGTFWYNELYYKTFNFKLLHSDHSVLWTPCNVHCFHILSSWTNILTKVLLILLYTYVFLFVFRKS